MVLEKLQSLIYKMLHLIAIAILVAFALGIYLWVYWNNSSNNRDRTEQEYINDEYFILTQDISADEGIRQPFTTDKDLHGATFVFHTYGEQLAGNITLDLLSADGELLTSGSLDMALLLNNTHHAIMFDTPITDVPVETDYELVIKANPTDENSNVALWRSDEPVDKPYLTQNGEATNTTLGFGIVTNRAGDFIVWQTVLLAILTVVVLVGGYLLLMVFKVNLAVTTAVILFSMGVIYAIVFPPRAAPDEEVHIHTAYYYSNNLLGIENEGTLTMRAGDADVIIPQADKLSVFSYQQVANDIFNQCPDETLVPVDARLALTEPFWIYLPTTLGVAFARVIGVNYITLIFIGRLFNLAAFALLMGLAISLTPKFKQIIAVVALLPSVVHLASTFSYDGLIIALATVFIALCLNIASQEIPVKRRQIMALSILGFLFAPMKAIYIFIAGFCSIIPSRLFKNKISYYISILTVLFTSLIGGLTRFVNIPVFATTWEDVENAPPPVIDYVEREFYNINYLLANLQSALKVLFNTIQENTWVYISQLVGGEMGEPILSELYIWPPLVFALLLILLLSTLTTKNESPLLTPFNKLVATVCMLCVCGVLLVVIFTWTPTRYITLWGLQGRYFLPILPLFLFAIQGRLIKLEKDITRPLLLAQLCCGLIAAVSIFQGVIGVLV